MPIAAVPYKDERPVDPLEAALAAVVELEKERDRLARQLAAAQAEIGAVTEELRVKNYMLRSERFGV